MATARRTKRDVSFDAEHAFAALTRLINDQRFVIDRLQRQVNDLEAAHAKLKDGYCKHVHKTHLSIEARLAHAGITVDELAR